MKVPEAEGGHGVGRDALSVAVPKLFGGIASLLIRIYPLRFLDPSAYGVLSFGLSCLMLYDALVGSALDLGTIGLITRAGACETARIQPAEKAAIRLKILASLALLAAFAIAGEWLGFRLLHGPGGRRFFLVLTAGGACILLLRSAQLYFQARLRFRVFGAIDLAHASLRVLLVGAVLLSGAASAVSILACFAVAPALIVCVCFFYANRHAGWDTAPAQWPERREVLRQSGPILASLSVSTVVSRLDMFLLAPLSTPAELGLYGAALTLAGIPETIGAYLAPVFLPRILPACRRGVFFGFFVRFHLAAYLLIGAGLAVYYLTGPALLGLLLPDKYAHSVHLVSILLPGTLAAAGFFPLTLNFLMLTRPRTFLIVDSVAAPVLALCYYLFLPAHGALAAAWISCVHRAAKAAVVQARAYAVAGHAAECRPAAVPVAMP